MDPFPAQDVFNRLFKAFGPQHWWPGDSPFEVMVGAILIQNTNWNNVEWAIRHLKDEGMLDPFLLAEASPERLAGWIRPAGYHNLKARRLKNFIRMFLERYQGSVEAMKVQPLETLRAALLAVNGIGPETADCMLLYALEKPVFVGDAYASRFLERHGWLAAKSRYDEITACFTGGISADRAVYNEYHALIVELGKRHCRTKPSCEGCPLQSLLPQRGGIGEGFPEQ